MNSVIHFEVPVVDNDRAKKFYEDTFGWQITPMPEMSYMMATTGPINAETHMPDKPGYIGGGFYKKGEKRSQPVIVIDVPSIDEAVTKITANGGTILEGKMPVGAMGFVAYFIDTEGSVMGIWETVPMPGM